MSKRFRSAFSTHILLGCALVVALKFIRASLIQVKLCHLQPVLLLATLILGALGFCKSWRAWVMVIILGRLRSICEFIILGGSSHFYNGIL